MHKISWTKIFIEPQAVCVRTEHADEFKREYDKLFEGLVEKYKKVERFMSCELEEKT